MDQVMPTDEVLVRRSDPIYNAHSYLTKVPVEAIIPFLERYSAPGDTVLDVFAGSGMTGVAAALAGRRAVLTDISELGRHVGTNYLRLVDAAHLTQTANEVISAARSRLSDIYTVPCAECSRPAELSRSVWSLVYECTECGAPVVFYEAIEGGRSEGHASCPACHHTLHKRVAKRLREERVLDVVSCPCSPKLKAQQPMSTTDEYVPPPGVSWPDLAIESTREMFRRSALQKHGLVSTASFFSLRNVSALAALHAEILKVEDEDLREKLLFGFTAILPRASKRYQWSAKRPLNAQNQTYYVAPVFYEWNVFDLYRRKVAAIRRSDDFIRSRIGPLFMDQVDVRYQTTSADDLGFLADGSVDYVFTDPPFGSNIFYSDMNLFQEAWLGRVTDHSQEAVIPTNGNREAAESRYEGLLAGALAECYRVLRKGGHLSLVFSNSSGAVWALAQRAIRRAGFQLKPDGISLLDKGQRSVKGLTSGYEHVVTTDLVLTMVKPVTVEGVALMEPPEPIESSVKWIVDYEGVPETPSRLYLRVIRRYLANHWELDQVHFGSVLQACAGLGLRMDARTGRFTEEPVSVR